MKLKLTLITNNKFLIKMEYKSSLQAVIYAMLDEKFAEWLHNKGFEYEKEHLNSFHSQDFMKNTDS